MGIIQKIDLLIIQVDNVLQTVYTPLDIFVLSMWFICSSIIIVTGLIMLYVVWCEI